jgi:PAS domain S-box-containing protein
MPIQMLTGVGGVRTPARIAAIYTAFGLLWIWLSDWVLLWLGYTSDYGFLTAVIKGTAFVFLTAALLFWLVRREVAAIQQSAILLRAVVEGTTDAVYVKDCDGRHLLVNEAAARFVGRPVADMLGRNNHELFESADAERLFAGDREIMAGGKVVTREETLTAAGVTRTYHATKAPLCDARGNLIGLIGISRDISEQKRAERDLFESEKRFRQLADAIPQIVWTAAPDGAVTHLNAKTAEYIGFGTEGLLGWSWAQIIHPGDLPDMVASWKGVIATGISRDIEFRIRRADGVYRWHVAREVPVRAADGTILIWYGTCTDIDDLKRTENALRETEARLREAQRIARLGSWSWEPPTDRVSWSDAEFELLGIERETAGPSFAKFLALVHPDDRAVAVARVEAMLAGADEFADDLRIVRPDGVNMWINSRARATRDATGTLVRVEGIDQDVTARRLADEAMCASEARYRLLFESNPHPMWVFDVGSLRFRAVNEAAVSAYGYSRAEFLAMTIRDIRPAEDVQRLDATIAGLAPGPSRSGPWRHRRKDGTAFDVEVSTHDLGDAEGRSRLVMALDISDRLRAEGALARRQCVLEEIAGGAALTEVLARIVDLIEDEIADSTCSILILEGDGRLRIGAAQHLPPEYNAAIDGIVAGPGVGSCGTCAHLGRAVIVADIATDPLWADFRTTALSHGLRACWSVPILTASSTGTGSVLGTFALYRKWASEPTPDELSVLHAAAQLAGIAIERERAGHALRASEERLQEAARVAGFGVFEHDHRTESFFWSPRLREIYGYDPDAPVDLVAYLALIHPDDRQTIAEAVRKAHDPSGDGRFDVRHRLIRPDDGRILWLATQSQTRFAGNGVDRHPVRTVGATMDVTAERETAEALQRSEERYRTLVETLPTSVHIIDDGRLTFCNPACVALFGAETEADLWGKTPFDLVHPESHELVKSRISAIVATRGRAPAVVVKIVRVDGQIRTVHAVATPVPNSRYPDTHLVCLNDITEQERSSELLRSVLASVDDAILTFDEQGVVQSVNPSAVQQFGYSMDELVGENVCTLMPEPYPREHDAYLANHFGTGAAKVIGIGREVEGRRRDGTLFPAELTVTEFQLNGKRHFTGVLRDITERKRLETQFLQAQKMESVGRLAGGVAHDFNNLLTVINGYCDFLIDDHPIGDPRLENLKSIRDAGERAAGLTQQLLAFSRKAIVEPQLLDLNDVLNKSAILLRRLIGEDVILAMVTSPAPIHIKVDPGQMDQIIMNLAVNARDAMPTGGRLTIEATTVPPSDGNAVRFARLTVSDTGHGISDEIKGKIFEPFFTTKGVGAGTGLGLAVVYGIVAQCGGRITVESAVGVGTTFQLLLPLAAGETSETNAEPPDLDHRGGQTVLLVEDEDAVRKFVRIALETQGFAVLEAAGGAEAVRHAETYPGAIHLLVSDVVMPEMGGRQLFETLRRYRPDLRVLFMSGYTDDAVLLHGVVEATDAFIQKPFTPLALARKVREVIDAPAS